MPRPVKNPRKRMPEKERLANPRPEDRQLYLCTNELPIVINRVLSKARKKDRMENKTSDKKKENKGSLPEENAKPEVKPVEDTEAKENPEPVENTETEESPEENAEMEEGKKVKRVKPKSPTKREDENEPLKDRLELAGIELTCKDRSSRKLVSYVLGEMGKHKKEAIAGEIIDIPYSRFVADGVYADRVSTEHALKEGCKVLRCLKLSSKNRKAIARRSKRAVTNLQASVFQYVYTGNNALHIRIDTFKAICEKVPGLEPSDFVNWNTVFSQYVKAPCWIYEVNELPFQIAKMALELSRMRWQRTRVVKDGKFRIHMPDLIEHLCLGEQKNLKQKVISPIENALKEMNRLAGMYPEEGLRFAWDWEGMTSRQICRDGYIEVEISGKIFAGLKEIRKPYRKPKSKEKTGENKEKISKRTENV